MQLADSCNHEFRIMGSLLYIIAETAKKILYSLLEKEANFMQTYVSHKLVPVLRKILVSESHPQANVSSIT
jgi:hypothetical protein